MTTDNVVTNSDSFWSTDLKKVEESFLSEGVKITDLPVALSEVVPPQGSVLLGKTINIDHIVSKPPFWKVYINKFF